MDRHKPNQEKIERDLKLKADFRSFQKFADILETPDLDGSEAIAFFDSYQKDPDCLITICSIMLKSIRPAAIKIAAIILLRILKQRNIDRNHLFDLLDSISQRANKSIIELDEITQGKLIQCIATICSVDSHFIENGRKLTSANTISYLMYLFEILFEGYSKNYIEIKKYVENYGPNFIALLYQNVITKDWLTLFSYVIKITQDLNIFYRLTPKLESIIHCSELYPYLINVLDSCQSSITIHGLTKCSVFVEKIIDIMLEVIKVLLSDEITDEDINMSIGIWEIILGFDAEFYAQDSIVSLMKKIVEYVANTIEVVIEYQNSFNFLIDSSSRLFGVLISQENTIHQETFSPFLDFLINFADNPENQTDALSKAFKNMTAYMGNVIERYFLQFETSDIFNEGIVFAIASTSKYMRKKICPLVLNRITSEDTLPFCTPFFTGRCASLITLANYPELYGAVLNGVSSCEDVSCNAFRRIAKFQMLFIAKDVDSSFEVALNGTTSTEPKPAANLICAGFHIMQGCTLLKMGIDDMISAIADVGARTVERIAGDYGVRGVSVYLRRLIKKLDIGEMPENVAEALRSIFFTTMEGLSDNWLHAGEEECSSDQELLCGVVRSALRKGWIQDKCYVASLICDAISSSPIPDHFVLLEDVIDVLPYEAILEKIKDFSTFEDPEVQTAALTFVMFLSMSNIQLFIEYFDFNFPLSTLTSENPKIVAIGLNILSVCLERSPDQVGLARAALEGICAALFQTFDNGVFELCFRMLVKIAVILGGPKEITDYILENAPRETDEFNLFAEHFLDSPDQTARLLLKELSDAYRE